MQLYPVNSGLLVGFEVIARLDPEATREAGHPKHKDVEYIRIHQAGERNNIPVRPIRDRDRAQYAEVYEKWRRSLAARNVSGMALEAWAGATRSEVEDLRAQDCYTVEQLAGMEEAKAQRLGHTFVILRQRAVDFLENAKGGAAITKLRTELEELKAQHEAALSQLAQAREELKILKSAEPVRRGPGRPPNSSKAAEQPE